MTATYNHYEKTTEKNHYISSAHMVKKGDKKLKWKTRHILLDLVQGGCMGHGTRILPMTKNLEEERSRDSHTVATGDNSISQSVEQKTRD